MPPNDERHTAQTTPGLTLADLQARADREAWRLDDIADDPPDIRAPNYQHWLTRIEARRHAVAVMSVKQTMQDEMAQILDAFRQVTTQMRARAQTQKADIDGPSIRP